MLKNYEFFLDKIGDIVYYNFTNFAIFFYLVPASVPYAYAQDKHKSSKFEKVPSKHAQHTRKELMVALSVRN
jgi:hypothetical protein